VKCNAHLNNTFYSYFRVHGRNQPRVFFHVRNGRVDAKRGFLQHGMLSGVEWCVKWKCVKMSFPALRAHARV